MNELQQKKLQDLESLGLYLYDNGKFLYLMNVETEKVVKLFYEKGEKLIKEIETFCDKILNK